MIRRSLRMTCLLIATAAPASATIHVPADQPTIQAAIDAAQLLGEEIIVAPGVYTGPGNTALDFRNKPVLLRSSGGANASVIDGESTAKAVSDLNGNTANWTVRGFTFVNCRNTGSNTGGAFSLQNNFGLVTIEQCVFRENGPGDGIWGGLQGPAIYVAAHMTQPINITDCLFEGNVAAGRGGAIAVAAGTVNITRCQFVRNTTNFRGGAIAAFGPNSIVNVDECVFWENEADFGGVFYLIDSVINATRCTMVGNSANFGSLAYDFGSLGVASILTVSHSIIASGTGRETVYCGGPSGGTTLTCSNLFGNDGGDWNGCISGQGSDSGNFSADPRFCSPTDGNFTIAADSPCAPGATGCGLIGALPVQCGPVSVEDLSWGQLKAGYRR